MTAKNNTLLPRFKKGLAEGVRKGWKGLLWLLKILVPISFATTLLVHFGILYKMDFLLAPVMNFIMLPASAALPLIIGLFTGIYGAVAAMAAIGFTTDQMILIAIFLLISHNIIQESIVQGKSGINPFFAAGFRLFMSFAVTFITARILGVNMQEQGAALAAGNLGEGPETFLSMLTAWGWDVFKLTLQIFCIIMPLMIVLEMAKVFNVILYITRVISPFLYLLGLSRNTGVLWLTAAVFGLTYGSAVIVEETGSNTYDKSDLTKLHLSIGINHAMVEDPALFLPLGIPALWLWIPRLVAAICVTWMVHIFDLLRRINAQRTCYKKLCNHR